MNELPCWEVTQMPWRVKLTLSEPVKPGRFVRVRVGRLRTLISLRPHALEVGGRPLKLVQYYSINAKRADRETVIRQRALLTAELDSGLAAGTELTLVVSGVGTDSPIDLPPLWPGAQQPFALSGQRWCLELVVADTVDAPVEAWRPVGATVMVQTVPGPAATLESYTRPDGQIVLRYLDAYLNPTVPDVDSAAINGNPVTLTRDIGAIVVRPTSASPATLRHRVTDATGRDVLSSPRPVAMDGTPIWFGDIHWHTEFSGDGERNWCDAVRSARDESAFDFTGPADHLHWRNSYADGHNVTQQAALGRALDAPGRFVVMPTFELSGREGHANIITDDWDLLVELSELIGHASPQRPGRYPLIELAALIPPGRGILVPHHTNMDSYSREMANAPDGRPVWCAFDWGPTPEHTATRLFEIHQGRGSFEDELRDPTWRIDCGGLGASARSALTRGFRIGFTGGTDNHCGWPGRNGRGWCGLTGIIAHGLDRRSLFAALYARRCFATTGPRMVGEFTLNNRPMGSELALAPADPRVFRIMLRGTAPWKSVQIISSGCVLADLPIEKDQFNLNLTWSDDRPGRPLRTCWYYIRARQVDGHCLWLSPVWIDLPDHADAKS